MRSGKKAATVCQSCCLKFVQIYLGFIMEIGDKISYLLLIKETPNTASTMRGLAGWEFLSVTWTQ